MWTDSKMFLLSPMEGGDLRFSLFSSQCFTLGTPQSPKMSLGHQLLPSIPYRLHNTTHPDTNPDLQQTSFFPPANQEIQLQRLPREPRSQR